MPSAIIKAIVAATLSLQIFASAKATAAPGTIEIVAIGASNTLGFGVMPGNTYPARLEALLRDKGFNARVTNSGVLFDNTGGMLRRLDASVPDGTRLVILQPGGNDLRFGGSKEQRAANIAAMVRRLHARHIKVIVFDPAIPARYYQWDGIHITSEGHAMFAASLLPQVISAIGR